MTVSELIAELAKYPEDMVVLAVNKFDEPHTFVETAIQEMYLTDKGDYEFARWGIWDDEEDYKDTPVDDYTLCKALVIG